MTTRDVGDRINLRYEARDADGDLVAATVALALTDPSGDVTAPTVTNPGLGLYDSGFTLTEVSPLPYRWKWTVSGTVVDVQYGEVYASDPAPGTYATLPQLRARVLGPEATEGDRDAALQSALSAATRQVDTDTGRHPGGFELAPAVSQRIFPVAGNIVRERDGRYKLLVDEFGSLTGLIVELGGDTTWTAVTDYRVDPRNALSAREPLTGLSRSSGWGYDEVRVTARWGWPAIPDQVGEATLILAHRLYRRPGSPEGVAGGNAEFGGIRLARMDPDYQRIVQSFPLPGIA